MADQDLNALAAKYGGGTATETAPEPDLDVLAKKYGSTPKSYDSALKPEQEAGYQKWLQEQKQKQGRDVSADTEDYDLKGYFLAGASNDDRGHGPDTFKKPNHPTFSTESQYSGKDNNVGGEWKEGPDGKTVFYASPTNLQYHSAEELQDYFKRVEPDAKLVLPTPPGQEPDLDALASKYGATGLDTLPPGPPSRPGVPGLTPPAQLPPRLNPRTGLPMYQAPPNPLDAAIAGPGQIVQGVERMATGLNPYSPQQVGRLKPTPLPGYDPEALPQGASQVIKGAMATASPLLPAALVAAPVDALITMGGAAVADELGKRALTAAGATPAWATLGGDVIALGVVGGGARAIFGKADAMLDAHNQTADILVEQERRGGTSAQRLDEVFGGESHPIVLDGGRKATLEYVGTGTTETGRPLSQWRVVDADGKTLHSGTSRMTQEWLTAQQAQADVSDAPRVGQNEKLDKVPERKRGAELEKTLAEMRADINTPTEPPTPHLYDYLTPEQHSIAKIIEEGAERYRDIDNMAKHLESGEDVQMHERTMESTTPAQRREMLQQTVEEHKAIYEQFWEAVGKELGSKDTPAIREAMEKEVREKYTRAGEEPPTEPVRPEATAPADQEYKAWRDANFTRNKQGMWEDKAGNMFTGEALEQEYGKRTVEPAKEHDFSSTQVNLAKPEADAVRSFAGRIPDEQLAEKGRETDPHITVKYGLHGNEPHEVADLLRDTAPIKATIGKLDVFKGKDADVLIAKIDSPDLHAVNGKIADALPHTDTFPDYTPHMTLAYLKPGEGDKYLGQEIPGLTGQQVTLNALTFSGKDGKATDIPLPGRPQFAFPFHAFGEGGPVKVLGRAGDDFRVQRPNGDVETMPGSSLMVNGRPILHGAAPSTQPPKDLKEAVGGAAKGITDNMYAALWDRVQQGKTTEAGGPSAVLQAAKLIREAGGLQSIDQFKTFAQEYSKIPRDGSFQQSMRDLVARYRAAAVQPPSTTEAIRPSAPTPAETAPVTPARPQAVQPPSTTTVYRAGANQLNAHGMTWFSTDQGYSTRNFGEAQPYQIAPDAKILDLPFKHDQPVTMPMLKAELEKQGVKLTPSEEQGLALALPSGGGGAQPFMFVRQELAEAAKRAGFDAIRVNEMYANDSKNAAPSLAVVNPNVITGTPALAKSTLEFSELPGYAQQAIMNDSMMRRTNEGGSIDAPDPYAGVTWQKQQVPIQSLRPGNDVLFGGNWKGHRGSVTKGPIVINDRDQVIDGNNRLYEAIQRGDTNIEVFRAVGAPKKSTASPAPGAHSEPARQQIEQAVNDGLLPSEGQAVIPPEPSGMPRSATITPAPEQPNAGQPESNPDTEAARGRHGGGSELDTEALGASLPEQVQQVKEDGGTPSESEGRSRTSRRGPGAIRGEGPEPRAGDGTGSGDLRNPTRRIERERPPRAQDVDTTRHQRDYRIPDGRVISGSPEARTEANLAAIRTLRTIEAEDRPATVDEQHILARYVGWGAVPQLFAGQSDLWKGKQNDLKAIVSEEEYEDAQRSTTNAHFTSDAIVDAMWNAMKHVGAQQGMSWLEPALGVGNFFGRQPEDLLNGSRRMGLDKDTISGKIAKLLYPDSGVEITALEKAELPPDYFDGIISNVPFGDFGVHDNEFRNQKFLTGSIHNYFFAKAATLVRPGGVVAFVTSRYTLDAYAQGHVRFREWMAERMDMIGAVRLPAGAFRQNAGTDVITDVIFLRRRLPGEASNGVGWTESRGKQMKSQYGSMIELPVNEYFHSHPEMILGTEGTSRGMYSANDYDVKGQLTPENLAAAIAKLPTNQFTHYERAKTRRVAIRELGVTTNKTGGLFFDKEGNLFRKTSAGSAEPEDATETVKARVRGQLLIRDILVKLHELELNDGAKAAMDAARKQLNEAYDLFTKKWGPLSNRANQLAMAGDQDGPLILSLERSYDSKDNTAEKTPIFTKRVLEKARAVTAADNPKEAMYVSLNAKGSLDWDFMAGLTGATPSSLQQELSTAGLVYKDPLSKTWYTAEDYLSGSVRKKLEVARSIAKLEPEFDRNVAALEKVQPVPIPPGEIRVILGATWIPNEVYGQFASEVLGGPVEVTYGGGEWFIKVAGRLPAGGKFDTSRVGGAEILKNTINQRQTKVYDHTKDGDVINRQETLAATNRQKEMNEAFQNWLLVSNPARADAMAKVYNDLNNDLREHHFDGSHLTLPGMSRAALRNGDLEPHQKSAVWRGISQPNVLLAHAVGTGKTYEMIAIGMELKRLGLIKRPMYNVPNETLGSWQDQFRALYPQARVLALDEKHLDKKRRRETLAKIQTQEWDAVIVPHSAFQKITTSQELFDEQYAHLEDELTEQILAATDAGLDPRFIKRMEKAKERTLARMLARRNAEAQDLTVTWEGLGIDQLFVDESHKYKKLGFFTKQANVAGIDQNGNQRTFDLSMKIRHTQKTGRGVVFATGTPITNTMGELFSIMRYLIEPELQARGLVKFDDWSANFGRTVQVFEPKLEGGGHQTKSRFAKFVNLPELTQLFRTFADVVTADMVKLPIPELKGGERQAILTTLTPTQREVVQYLRGRAAGIRRDPRNALPDNLLAVYTDAQKMALDVRMLLPDAEHDPDGRLQQAADLIHKIWQDSEKDKGVQLVFADFGKPADAGGSPLFSPYDALIKLLQEKGIPANEIAHIYQAKNKVQREKLFDKVRKGQIRVILGSTDKMGVGVNIQDRAIALHHLDIPHRPDQLEQREGRILRQGNLNPEVGIYYYLTKESLDESKFANVVRKGKFVNAALRGTTTVREMEDVEGMVISLEQFQAMVSGDPRVMRKIQVDAEVERLGSLKSSWRNQQYNRNRRIDDDRHAISGLEREIAGIQQDITKKTDEPNFVVGKQKITGEGAFSKASDALHMYAMETVRTHKGDDRVPIGSAYGLPITVDKRYGGTLYLGNTDWWHLVDIKPAGLMHAIQGAAKTMDKAITAAKGKMAALHLEISSIEEELGKGWPYEDQLEKAIKEQEELFKALGGDKDDDTAMAMGEGEEIADANVEGESEPDDESAEEDRGEAEEEPAPSSDVMRRLNQAREQAKAAAPPDPKRGAPMSYYRAGAGKLATPSDGWTVAKVNDKLAFSDGRALFEGEAPTPGTERGVNFQLAWDKAFKQEMLPLQPVGYSKLPEKMPTGAERLVWFDNGTAIDARYYDYAKKRWKDAAFKQSSQQAEAVAVSAEGRDVGIIMPLRSAPPAGIMELVQKFLTEETGTSNVGQAVSDIVHQTVIPGIRSASTTYNGVRDDLQKLFAPHLRSYGAKNVGGLVRETGGELAQRRDRAKAALEDFRAYFEGEPILRRFEIIDSIETGNLAGLSDYERNFVHVMRDLLAPRQQELEDLGLLKHFIENYFPHYWKNPEEAAKFVDNWMSKRPFAGSEAYKRRRTIPTIREGMDDPEFHLVPAFDNPVDFVLAKLGEVDKSIVAHKAFNELRDGGRITYIPSWRKLPAGMEYIDDRLFVVRGPRKGAVGLPDEAVHAVLPGEEMEEGGVRPEDVTVYGKREMGRWAAVEPVSRVLNNHLSPGPYRGSLQHVFKAWSGINSTMNMIELGFSWFHGMTTALNSSISDVALSMAEIQAGKPLAAVKSFTRGVVPFASIVYDMFYGTEIQRVWDGKPGDPMTEALVDALKAAGGRARQDPYWTTSHADAFMKALRQGGPSLLGLPFRLPFAVLEATIKPIMGFVVPRAKLSAFAKRAQMEIERRPDMTRDEARKVFGDIWDSVDNRFGQLVQDNMLMNRTARGVLNAIVGRPGWNIGTVRELGGGAWDMAKAIAYVGGGPRPNITDRTRYLIAMLIVAFLWNGILNYALTGDMPRGMDFLMPRDGGYQEDGHPSRVVLPFYVSKDVYSYFTNFRQTLLNKLKPGLTMAGDLFQNRDYYHRKIYGEGGIGVLPFLSNFYLPYSVQGIVQNYGRGEKAAKMAMPLLGVMPAPRRAGLSEAEKFMSDYWADQRPGTIKEKTERQRVTAQVTQQLRAGNKDAAFATAKAAVGGGVIRWQDVERAVVSAQTSPVMSELKGLPLETAIQAEKLMTPEERQKTAKIFADKVIRQLPTKAPNERKELWQEIQNSGILRRQ